MRLTLILLLVFGLFSKDGCFASTLDIQVDAESAILINGETGAILFEKNAHTQMFPASITKIATALYTLSVYGEKLETVIKAEHDSIASVSYEAKKRSNFTLPSHWLEPGATHIGIKRGEELPLESLLYGVLLSSANDASNVIAQYIGGSVPNFMKELNSFLQTIGCRQTYFKNPHGLHHPEHRTTAYDMAIIAKEAMKYPQFRKIVKTVKYTRPQTNKQAPSTLIQGNRLLRKGKHYYPKATGIKTGWTSAAKSTLVASAEHNGRTLIAVLIKVKNRDTVFQNARKMFEAAFNQPLVQKVLLKGGEQRYALNHPEASYSIKTYLKKDVCIDFYPAEEPHLKCTLKWLPVKLPLKKGEHVGDMLIASDEGVLIQKVPLFSTREVKKSWWSSVKSLFMSSDHKSEVVVVEKESKTSNTLKALGLFIALAMLILLLFAMRKPR